MIKIEKYADVSPDFFKGRSFGEANEVVTSVLEEVVKRGDAALRLYGQKFDVAVPAQFEVPQEELKAAAEKLRIEKRDVYDAIVYSHDLALRFANPKPGSYTATLDAKRVREKVEEEAEELCEADGRDEVIWEAADLIYFVNVLMYKEGVTWKDVYDELDRRHKEK